MGLKDLGAAMKAARDAKGWWQHDAVSAAGSGVSKSQWSKLENGHPGNYKSSTFAAIDRALQWDQGKAQRLADGTVSDVRRQMLFDSMMESRRRHSTTTETHPLPDEEHQGEQGAVELLKAQFVTTRNFDALLEEVTQLRATVDRLALVLEGAASRSLEDAPDDDDEQPPGESPTAQ